MSALPSPPTEGHIYMHTIPAFIGAAIAEIAGCYAFWAWLKLDKPIWWLIPGVASLALFAYLLTLVDSDAAGRVYAAYGGVYIAASLTWLWIIEGVRPDRWDISGVIICLVGATIIIAGPRSV
jgi:small multidrug resistance family-3 protein